MSDVAAAAYVSLKTVSGGEGAVRPRLGVVLAALIRALDERGLTLTAFPKRDHFAGSLRSRLTTPAFMCIDSRPS